MLEMFRRMFLYIGVEFAGKVLVKAYDRGAVAENKEDLARAYALGASL
jgi:hypothetical protein